MKIRQLVVGLLVAGVATVGATGVAAAKSPSPHNSPGTRVAHREKEDDCKHARERLEDLKRRKARVEAHIDRLQKDLERARDHHREDLAERLERELDKAQHQHEQLVDEINRIEQHCHDW